MCRQEGEMKKGRPVARSIWNTMRDAIDGAAGVRPARPADWKGFCTAVI